MPDPSERRGTKRLLDLDLPRPSAIAAELEDELRFHLDLRTEQLMRQGLSRAEAVTRAREQYGAVDSARSDMQQYANRRGRRMRLVRWAEAANQDVRFALRGLGRQKGWTAVAVLTLALGIGANTAVFSAVNNLVLDPLRYPAADRLVLITRTNRTSGFEVSPTKELREAFGKAGSLEGLHGFAGDDRTLQGDGVPRAVRVNLIEPDFLSFAGARLVAGRGFLKEESNAGAPLVALLSESEWRSRYGAARDAVGRTVTIDGKVYTIVGVLADGLRLPSYSEARAAFWLPLTPDISAYSGPLVARLRTGVTIAAAEGELQSLANFAPIQPMHGASEDVPGAAEAGFTVEVRPPGTHGSKRQSLMLLTGAVALLLLIACANVAHLLLARGAAREREMAIRSALGAGSGRIMNQLLTESLMLSITGGIVAIAVGAAGLKLLVAFRPPGFADLVHAQLDMRVLGLTMTAAVVTGIVFGLIAGRHGLRLSGFTSLREAGGGTGDPTRHRARSLLVITEMALSAVLVVGASLLVRTVINLYHIDPGFDSRDLHAMSLPLPGNRFNDAARNDIAVRLLEGAQRTPGIRSATVAWMVPPEAAVAIGAWRAEGATSPDPRGGIATMNMVRPDYFSFMGTDFIAGRTFEPGAVERNEVVVSESMARLLWGRTDVVGLRFRNASEGTDAPWLTIVGVVPNAAMLALRDDRRTPTVYYPSRVGAGYDGATLIFRAGAVPAAALQALSLELIPDVPPPAVRRVSDLLIRSVAMQRFLTALLTLFAVLAVALSAIGLYGVIAWNVRQRLREIGIRVALGAARRDIVRLVVRQGMALTSIGLVLGCAAAVGATRVIQAMLYGVSSLDVASFVVAGVVLMAIAALACLAPTARALRVDPVLTLRSD